MREAEDAPEETRVEEEDDTRRQVVTSLHPQQSRSPQQVQPLTVRRDVTTFASLQTCTLKTTSYTQEMILSS